MSVQDVMPFQGDPQRHAAPIAASESFLAGELLILGTGGTIAEAADDPSSIDGIAAMNATTRNSVGFLQPAAARATGEMVTYYAVDTETIWEAQRFATAGAGVAVTPTQGNAIGELAGFTFTGGNWILDTGANNDITKIINVRDTAGNLLTNPNIHSLTGSTVLFRFL